MADSKRTSTPPHGWYERRLDELGLKKADQQFVKQGYAHLFDKIQDLTRQTSDLDDAIDALSRDVTGIHVLEGNLAEMKKEVETNTKNVNAIYKWHSKLLAGILTLIISSAATSLWYQSYLSDTNLNRLKQMTTEMQANTEDIKDNVNDPPEQAVPVAYIKSLVEDATAQAARKAVQEFKQVEAPSKKSRSRSR